MVFGKQDLGAMYTHWSRLKLLLGPLNGQNWEASFKNHWFIMITLIDTQFSSTGSFLSCCPYLCPCSSTMNPLLPQNPSNILTHLPSPAIASPHHYQNQAYEVQVIFLSLECISLKVDSQNTVCSNVSLDSFFFAVAFIINFISFTFRSFYPHPYLVDLILFFEYVKC